MSAPVIQASDLATYLVITNIDVNRAVFIIAQAQALCESIVNPLPTGASAVVLDVAARAFVNPQQIQEGKLGTADLKFGQTQGGGNIGGLYLSRANKANLRNLAGRGGAFGMDQMPTGVNAVQAITLTATGGTFTLAFGGVSSVPIAWNATAAQVQAALFAVGAIGVGNVSVTGASPSWSVTFINQMATTPLVTLVADGTQLTGGTVSVVTTTAGVAAPGQNLPPWDYDYYQPSSLLGSQIYGPF